MFASRDGFPPLFFCGKAGAAEGRSPSLLQGGAERAPLQKGSLKRTRRPQNLLPSPPSLALFHFTLCIFPRIRYTVPMKRATLFYAAVCCLIVSLLFGCKPQKHQSDPAEPTEAPIVLIEAETEVRPVEQVTPTPVPTPSPTPTPAPTPTPTPDPFARVEKVVLKEDERFYYAELTEELKVRITGLSFPEDASDCRMTYEDLRYVGLMYIDYNGEEQVGELMVHRMVAQDILEIFYKLYLYGYQLSSVRLVDDYGQPGQDSLSMADNNTSAFCYRKVNNSKKLSWHSFGAAVDINPVENPYINGKSVSPEAGRAYLDRKDLRPHMITHEDYAYTLFKEYGWKWGGDFKGDKDYQHFYKDIGLKR